VELPITIVFEPPSRAELRAVLRERWRMWVLAAALLAAAIGILVAVVGASRAEALATADGSTLEVRSRPAGADIWLDGQLVGQTPRRIAHRVGQHSLRLKAPDAAEFDFRVDLGAPEARFEALLWRRQPLVTRLRAPVPGAALSSVHLARDGSVSLVVSLPPDRELQAWRFEPVSDAYVALQTGIPAARLAIAPDGPRGAYVGREIGPVLGAAAPRDQIVWLASGDDPSSAPRALWRAPADEILLDTSWSPDGQYVLATTGQQLAGGAQRNRVWLIDVQSSVTRALLALPSQVVPGSFVWSPDAQRVAMLAHAGALNALCLLELDGAFRYVADLEPSDGMPLPYPPLNWSGDGQRALLAAPARDPSTAQGGWLQPSARRAVHAVDAAASTARLVSDVDAALAGWREDGQVITLGRGRDGNLGIDLLGDSERAERLIDIPLRPGAPYAAEWDVARGRILVAARTGGAVEYWLIQLGLDEQS
jgi:hypothetical protein